MDFTVGVGGFAGTDHAETPASDGMTADDTQTDDESEPASKTRRYLQIANLVVRFIVNVVKLVVMLTT